MFKKILSIVLSLCIIISTYPVAYADIKTVESERNNDGSLNSGAPLNQGEDEITSGIAKLDTTIISNAVKDNEQFNEFSSEFSSEMKQITAFFHPEYAQYLDEKSKGEIIDWDMDKVINCINELPSQQKEKLYKYVPIAKNQYYYYTNRAQYIKDIQIADDITLNKDKETKVNDRTSKKSFQATSMGNDKYTVTEFKNTFNYSVDTDELVDLTYRTANRSAVDLEVAGKPGLDIVLKRKYNSLDSKILKPELHMENGKPNSWYERDGGNLAKPYEAEEQKGFIATGWTLNIPSMEKSGIKAGVINWHQINECARQWSDTGQCLEDGYRYEPLSKPYTKMVFSLEDGTSYEFHDDKIQNYPYQNVNLVKEKYSENKYYYYLSIDEKVTYKFNDDGAIISKSNQYGDMVSYVFNQNKEKDDYNIIITDSYNRMTTIYRDSNFRIKGFKYEDQGTLVKELFYNVTEAKSDLTFRKWTTDGYKMVTEDVVYWKLDSVEDRTNTSQENIIESYNYYNVDATTVADFNFIVDIGTNYFSEPGGELLHMWGGGGVPNCYSSNEEKGICFEGRTVAWRTGKLYGEIPYLLLKQVIYNNGLTANFSYSTYDSTWSAKDPYLRNHGGVTRLYHDKYALEYISYHPVNRLDFKYVNIDTSTPTILTNYYNNIHLEEGKQVGEYWKVRKQDIPRLRKSSRFGDSQVVEVRQPTVNGAYNSTFYHSSIINGKFLTDYIITNHPKSYSMNSKDDNNNYSFKRNSITQFEYEQNQHRPNKVSTYHADFDISNAQYLMNPSLITDITSKLTETYSYDSWGELTSQTDSLGNTLVKEYNGPNHQISKSSVLEQGNVKSTTEYSYYSQSEGNKSKRDNLEKITETFTYKDIGDNNTSKTDVKTTEFMEYDPVHRKSTLMRNDSEGAQFGIEKNASEKSIIYTDRGLIKEESMKVTLNESDLPTLLTMRYEYFPNGSLKNVIYPDGNLVSYKIDNQNRIVSNTIKPPTGEEKTTGISYDDKQRIVTMSFPDGEKVEEHYSPFGIKIFTERTVNGVSRMISDSDSPNGKDITATYALKQLREAYKYDSNGRVIERTNALGQKIKTNYFNTTQFTDGTQAPQLTNVVEYPDGKTETSYYDTHNRLIKLVESAPNRTKVRTKTMTYSSSGNLLMEKIESNGASQTTHFGYDSNGNLIYLKNNLGEEYRYIYNSLGQLLEIYTNKQKTKTVKYNEIGWQLAEFDGNGNKDSYQYKNNGLVNKSTNRLGEITNYSYTPYNEVEKMYITDSLGSEKHWIKNNYDPRTRVLTSQETSEGERVSYQFDEWKRNIGKRIGSREYTFEYDEYDRMVKLNYPGGDYTKYWYDDLNRITQVKYKEGSETEKLIGHYSYTTGPDEHTYMMYNGQSQVREINSFKEVTSFKITPFLQNPKTLWDERVTSDGLSNITSIRRNGITYNYSYDGLNRIVQENRNTYKYDDRGNRLTLGSDILVMESTVDYSYNALNQLKSVSKNGNSATYTYYGDGLRATKTINDKKTRYVYVDGKIIEELRLDEKGNVLGVNARNIWGNELLYRKDFQNDRAGSYRYNAHGDVIGIVEAGSGSIEEIKSYDYDIWGNSTEVDSDPNKPFNNPFKYAGEFEDEESGLIYLRARYYDPSSGRFITEDTYGGQVTNPLSLNLYTYAYNNPISLIDPSGHAPVGPGKGSVFDTNQWKYLSELAKSSNKGQAAWANKQIKNQMYYKDSTPTKSSASSIAIPAPVVSVPVSEGFIAATTRVLGSIVALVSISGSSSEKDRERQHTVYRALTKEDVASLASGNGIVARNPIGNVSITQHVLQSNAENSPWISTTKLDSVAKNRYESGYGVVSIDTRKVTSKIVYAPFEIPHDGGFYNDMALEMAERDQEYLVHMFIPQSAITGYVK